jgi:hypothetical protein
MITEDIVAAVRGRFLKKDHGASGWIVISGHARRVKVAQALQYRQRRFGEGPCCRRIPAVAAVVASNGPSTALYHNSRSSFASCVSSGSAPSLALDSDMAPEETVSMPCAASTKCEQSRLFSPEVVGSSVSSVVPTSVMFDAMESTTDEAEHSFDPCNTNEPVHVSDDELLWALGYPSNACSDDEDVDDNCSIGYTRDEYDERQMLTPDESKSCCFMQSRAPVSPYHDSRLTLKMALDQAQPIAVPSTAATALPDIDIFWALEQAGFLENADCSEQ